MSSESHRRPRCVTALIIFFAAGSLISFLAAMSFVAPNGFFELMWRVNPRGHEGLTRLGLWAVALLFAASVSCAAAAIGLWRNARWGQVIAVTLITINLLSDIANAASGAEPRAIVGVPIAVVLLLYLLSKDVREFFNTPHLNSNP